MKQRTTCFILAVVLICVLSCLSACDKPDDIDISSYEDRTVTLTGITDEPVTLSVAQLKEMDCKTIKTESTSDKIGVVRATGPWLDTILKPYGVKQDDFAKIIITGADEYDTKLLQDYLKDNPIMLAFGIDGEPLEDDALPCRIIIRNSDSSYWVRQVKKIEFIR